MRSVPQWALWLLIALPLTLSASDKWIEIKSPNFRVISDGPEKQTRNLALNFEQIRAVVPKVLLNLNMTFPRPLVIVALKNEESMLKISPKYGAYAGFYGKTGNSDYAVVRLDIGDYSTTISYQAYVHELIEANFPNTPAWMALGLPSFFANSRIQKDRVLVGIPGSEVRGLRGARVFSLKEITTAQSESIGKFDLPQSILFSDECWAVAHFFFFGEGMGRGQKFGAYLTAVKGGADPVASVERAFGRFSELELPFNLYLRKFSYDSFAVQTKLMLDPNTFSMREVPKAEIDPTLKAVREYVTGKEKGHK
jgi:hypothetical protein